MFFFRLLFFSKIVDHLWKCTTILGREKECFDFNCEKSRKCFLFDKITGKYSVVFAYFSSSFFIIIIFFLSVCFKTGEKKLLFKSSHFDIITFFFKIQLSFFILPFFLFFCWDFVLNKGHFHVLSIFVIATNFENQTANVAWNLFLWDSFNHLGHCHFHSLLSPS